MQCATQLLAVWQSRRRTAELVGLTPVAEIEPDLAEWDYGDYEGQLSVDIRKGRPDWTLFRDGCPSGEMPAQVSDRADRLIARLRAQDGNVALFSHGHFGCVLAVRWIGLPVIDGQISYSTPRRSASSAMHPPAAKGRSSRSGTHNQPPVNPARRNPPEMCGQPRVNRHTSPVR